MRALMTYHRGAEPPVAVRLCVETTARVKRVADLQRLTLTDFKPPLGTERITIELEND